MSDVSARTDHFDITVTDLNEDHESGIVKTQTIEPPTYRAYTVK